MKKHIILCLLAFCFLHSDAQSDSTYLKIRLLNLASFEGKPVDSLLAAIPAGYSWTLLGSSSSNKISFLDLSYPDKTTLTIWVKDFNFMNPLDPNRQWDFSLYRKETLSYTCVYSYKHNGWCSYDLIISIE